MSNAINYRADVDGLRAVAVVAVALFHADLGIASGGFVGVDVFFVISGFLISSIVLKELAEQRFSLLDFYERRIRRIFPALFTVIAASFVVAALWFPPFDFIEFGSSAIAAAAFFSNFHFQRKADYFAPEAETQPLLHTWSLGVEEQFYLLAPLLLMLMVWRGPRLARPLFGVLFAASLAASAYFVEQDPSIAFYMLPTRAFELMTGMALALGYVPEVRSAAMRQAGAFLGAALVVAAIFLYSSATPFPGFAALVPSLGTALLIHCNRAGDTIPAKALALRPIVFTGKLSYSFYLWHWPVLAFASYQYADAVGPTHRVLLLIGALLLAYATYRFVETPARRRAPGRSGWRVLGAGAVAILVCFAASQLVRQTGGLPTRLPADAADFALATPVKVDTSRICISADAGVPGGRSCAIGWSGDQVPGFLVLGDSHVAALADQIARTADAERRTGYALFRGGCPPLLDLAGLAQREFRKCVLQFAPLDDLLARPALTDVILIGRWAVYSSGQGSPNETATSPRLFVDGTAAENHARFESLLGATIDRMVQSGHRVTLIGPIPELPYNLPAEMTKALMRGDHDDFSIPLAGFLTRQANVLAMLARLDEKAGVRVLYPHETLCDQARCIASRDGKALYVDDDHLSPAGAALIAPLLREALTPSVGS